jgi:hypothetical protein
MDIKVFILTVVENFGIILGIDTEIHETTKIDAHEEKYFHSICVGKYVKNIDQAFQ